MRKYGHYYKVCDEYKASEKFSDRGHAFHIYKSCASLPAEKQAELMTLNRPFNPPWRLSKERLSWLENRPKDRRPDVREPAQEQYKMGFPPRHLEDDDSNFLDEESFIEQRKRSTTTGHFLFGRGIWPMVTTRIMPLHVGKDHIESRAIGDITGYVANPKRTDNGRFITGYACDSRTAGAESLLTKRLYITAAG